MEIICDDSGVTIQSKLNHVDENKMAKQTILLDIVQAFVSKRKIKIVLNYNNNGDHYYYLGYVSMLKDDIVGIDHHYIELKNIYKTKLS